jgi:hypothetical protein
MYHYLCGAYLLWRYSYILDYGYKAYCYGSYISSALVRVREGAPESEDWVLCDTEDSVLVKNEK